MGQIRIDVYSNAGAKVSQLPLYPIACKYSVILDEIGAFQFAVRATELSTVSLALAQQVWIHHEGEGFVFKGYVGRIETLVDVDDSKITVVSGDSVAREMVWGNTLLNLTYQGQPLSTVIDDLTDLAPPWGIGTIKAGTSTDLKFRGVSAWKAMLIAAEYNVCHVREDSVTHTVDVDVFGVVNNLLLTNFAAISPVHLNEADATKRAFPITNLKVLAHETDVWNRIIGLGGGENLNELTLQHSTGAGISSATGPDGETYYYMRDATSETAYGIRTRVKKWEKIYPITNDDTGHLNAANALHGAVSTAIARMKDPLTTYEVQCAGMKHFIAGTTTPYLEVGDKLSVLYQGIVEDVSGRRSWLNIDADLWLMGFEREWDERGNDLWNMELSTVDRHPVDDDALIGSVVDEVSGIKLSDQLYTYVREQTEVDVVFVGAGFSRFVTPAFTEDVRLHQVVFELTISGAAGTPISLATRVGGVDTDRTGALGGPWGNGTYTLDLTSYFTGNYQQPVSRTSSTFSIKVTTTGAVTVGGNWKVLTTASSLRL